MRFPDFVNMWPTSHIVDSVGGRIQLVNKGPEPRVVNLVNWHEHVCMAHPTTSSNFVDAPQPAFSSTAKETKSISLFHGCKSRSRQSSSM